MEKVMFIFVLILSLNFLPEVMGGNRWSAVTGESGKSELINYPPFSVKLGPSQTFRGEVTNVGAAHSTYLVQVVAPHGVEVIVKPDRLYFSEVNQKLTYSVTCTKKTTSSSGGGYNGGGSSTTTFAQGYLMWMSSGYVIRSPIAVEFV